MKEKGEDGMDGRRMEVIGLSLGGELSRFVDGFCRGERTVDWIGGKIERNGTVSSRSTVDNGFKSFGFLDSTLHFRT